MTPASSSAAGERVGDANVVVLTESRAASIGALTVRRALPTRGRRTVGAWCFVDHMGPESLRADVSIDVAPHPHTGLQTVTWLFSGEFLHRDSLGSEQLIRAGQLNLMTSGHGVAHSEENPGLTSGEMHGVQLWVAQPSSTRDDDAGFEHFAELPRIELAQCTATVLVGSFGDAVSSARRDSSHVGVELDFHGGVTTTALDVSYEYAIIVANGAVRVDDMVVVPGQLAYLGTGRDECRIESDGPSRAMLIGGVPFDEKLFMWWNFVARSEAEISEAWRAWASGDERFGPVASRFARIDVAPPPWLLSLR
jgi:redox-sensitive bicupin YhaK (pirin superfamily)